MYGAELVSSPWVCCVAPGVNVWLVCRGPAVVVWQACVREQAHVFVLVCVWRVAVPSLARQAAVRGGQTALVQRLYAVVVATVFCEVFIFLNFLGF